jgi:hypothetical protein
MCKTTQWNKECSKEYALLCCFFVDLFNYPSSAAVEAVLAPPMMYGMTLQNCDEGEPEEKVGTYKLPSDGFKWRKYGRKTVEGQGNHWKYGSHIPSLCIEPILVRHYYRCSSQQGCTAKRHVTWSSNNIPTIVAIGEHEHYDDNLGTFRLCHTTCVLIRGI